MRPSLVPIALSALSMLLACGGDPAPAPPTPEASSPQAAEEAKPTPPAIEAIAPADSPTFVCHTTKHRVHVLAGDGPARYRSWRSGAPEDAPPDLELGEGLATSEGSGACRLLSWTFENADVTFEVQRGGCGDPDSTAEPAPGPDGWTGRLRVRRGEEVLSDRRCGAEPERSPPPLGTPTAAASADGERGSARYGDWTVAWGGGWAAATGPDGKALDVYRDREERDGEYYMRLTHRLLSAVGPYISYAVEFYAEGGAHPSYGTTWEVVDVRDRAREVDLRDLFAPPDLYGALKADRVIHRALRGSSATDLGSLLASLDGGCSMDLGPGATRRFAFHRLEGDRVAVRLGAGAGCEAERGTFTEIELLLPIGELMSMLVPASAAGTLMKDH